MYARTNVTTLDGVAVEGIDPEVVPVGKELRSRELRPNVWRYEAGDSSPDHYHEEQEELYVVLSGRFELELADETLTLADDDAVVVSPDERRTLTALTDGVVLIVGAPSAKDDGVRLD